MQIQLPDDLCQRAKTFAAHRELSLAEVIRRALKLFLEQSPASPSQRGTWHLPCVDGGGIKVPLAALRRHCRR
jgi:hypothetical protein